MKTKQNRKSGHLILVLISIMTLVFLTHDIYAQWIQDTKYGFKIKLPPGWSKKNYIDGTDKVYDFYSADQNAAVQLRVFVADNRVTTDVLIKIYEQQMLPKGAVKESLKDHITENGIPGKTGVYSFVYNGKPVTMAAFYTIQNHKGYVLTAMIPTGMIQQKGAEVRSLTHSFMLDGFSPPGSSSVNSSYDSGSANTTGKHSIVLTSHYAYDFSTGKVLPFAQSTGGIALYSGCEGLPQIEGKYIITGGDRFEDVISWNQNKLSKIARGSSKRVPLKKVCIYQLRDGSYAKFIVIEEQHENSSHGCLRKLKLLVENPARTMYGMSSARGEDDITGRYNFVGRSDGKDLLNYWYIILKKDGTYIDKHQLKDEGQYTTGDEGTWKKKGNKVTLYNKYYSSINTTYTIQNDKLIRTTSNNVIFTFKK